MGRPQTGDLSSFDPTIVEKIRAIRTDYEELGGLSIQTRLKVNERYTDLKIPGRSSIARFLKNEGYIKKTVRKSMSKEDVCQLPPVEFPNQRWQVDAKGNEEIEGLGIIGLINIKDVYSRKYVGIYPVSYPKVTACPTGDDYRLALRLAFADTGLPQEIQCDRAGVFYDNQNETPFPTLFHLWLIGLGIKKVNSRRGTPTDQGAVERQNRTTYAQINRNSGYQSWEALYIQIEQWRNDLNKDLPCSSLDNKAPLEAFPTATHTGKWYRPELGTTIFDLTKVDHFLSKLSWKRKISANGTVKIAKQNYTVARKNKGEFAFITFDAFTRHFVFKDKEGLLLATRPAKGIDEDRILGTQPFFLPTGFQLQLPLNQIDNGNLRLNETQNLRVYET